MRAKFVISVELERTIDCYGCDHCKEHTVSRRRKGWKHQIEAMLLGLSDCETISYGFYCALLHANIRYQESKDPADSPCKFEKWQQTNNDYELFAFTHEVVTLHFTDRKLEAKE